MRTHWVLSMASVLLLVQAGAVAAQDADECRGRADFDRCALIAAGFDAAPDAGSGVIRQVRFSDGSGPPHYPHRGVLLRETANDLKGWVFYTWPASAADGEMATSMCGERWSNDAAMLCFRKAAHQPDWRMVRDSLVTLGFFASPDAPAPPHCYGSARAEDTVLGQVDTVRSQTGGTAIVISGEPLPRDTILCVVGDGLYVRANVWDRGATWEYTITSGTDPDSPATKRDMAVTQLLFDLYR